MRGATFDLTARVDPGTQDYTGANLRATARYGFHGEQLFAITESTSDGSVEGDDDGRIRIGIPWTVTALWEPRTYQYVVQLEVDSDVWEPILQGRLVVTPNPEI
jgi:hypothetical protein